MQCYDYRIRCHWSRGDSGQGEAERTNSAIGDAVGVAVTFSGRNTRVLKPRRHDPRRDRQNDFGRL